MSNASPPAPAASPNGWSRWDVIVVGAGPAGLSAATAAAKAGGQSRVLVLERATHPRYKTCGGGLTGFSLANLPDGVDLPVRAQVTQASFTLAGRLEFTRTSKRGPIVTMINRDAFDASLKATAIAAGVRVREQATVRALRQHPDHVVVRLAGGEELTAAYVVGADGSAGITAAEVGVTCAQVDLGLEVELGVGGAIASRWRHRLHIDWGTLPGSYGWLFPKGDVLTVGVIAGRGEGAATRHYLSSFVRRLGLAGIPPLRESGHLTRCRSADSPLYRGRVLVAGDAAGLLEPWTREGISYALRSGAWAGAAAARGDLASYATQVRTHIAPSMAAGTKLLSAFGRRPGLLHAAIASPPGWAWFTRFCRGEASLDSVMLALPVRAAVSVLGRRGYGLTSRR